MAFVDMHIKLTADIIYSKEFSPDKGKEAAMRTVFVSSTFKDMQAERDILKSQVQPQLNNIARKYGESVSFSDLRWGVDTTSMSEEEQNEQVLSVCLNEIDRSRPYMIVLLGERYGYMPGADMIRTEVRKRPRFSLKDLDISVTQLEIEYGALSTKEAQRNTWFYFRELDSDDLPEGFVEISEEYKKRLESLKQRIRALAGDRVRFYKAHWDGSKVTDLDQFVSLVKADLQSQMEPEWERLSKLNAVVKTATIQQAFINEQMAAFSGPEVSFIPKGIEDLQVLKDIYFPSEYRWPILDVLYYAKYLFTIRPKGLKDVSDLTRIRKSQTIDIAATINERVYKKLQHKRAVVVLRGESGSGKTMTMMNTCRIMEKAGFRVIEVYVGSTSMLSSIQGVLLFIIYQMETLTGRKHKYLNKDSMDADEWISSLDVEEALNYLNEMADYFSARWYRYARYRILIAIDGFEKLPKDKYRDSFMFCMEHVTEQVRVLYTANADTFIPDTEDNIVTLINGNEAESLSLIQGSLDVFGKQLSEPVKEALIKKESASNPLYLRMAVTRLTLMDSSDFRKIMDAGDGMDAINQYLLELIHQMPDQLDEMAYELLKAAGERVNAKAMERIAVYIAVSRSGLRSDDLVRLVNEDGYEMSALSLVQFVNYMNDLFILREDGRYDFMHPCMRKGVLEKTENISAYRRHIAEYIRTLPEDDLLRKKEQLYHELNAGSYENALEIMADTFRSNDSYTVNYAYDFINAAETNAGGGFYDSLHRLVRNNPDRGLEAAGFLSHDVIPQLSMTKADEDCGRNMSAQLSAILEDCQQEERKARILFELSSYLSGIEEKEILIQSWQLCRKAEEFYSSDENIYLPQRLQCLDHLAQLNLESGYEELWEEYPELNAEIIRLRNILKQKRSDSSAQAIVAYTDLILAKQLIQEERLEDMEQALAYTAEAYEYMKKDRLAHPGQEADKRFIEAASAAGDVYHILKDKASLKKAEKYYKEADGCARDRRDRSKDSLSIVQYILANSAYNSFLTETLENRLGLFAFLKQRDAKSDLRVCVRSLYPISNLMAKGTYFRLLYLTQAAIPEYESAIKSLERISETMPDFQRIHLKLRYGLCKQQCHSIIYSKFKKLSRDEKYKLFEDAYSQTMQLCKDAYAFSKGGQDEDRLLVARCRKELTDLQLAVSTEKYLGYAEHNSEIYVEELRNNVRVKKHSFFLCGTGTRIEAAGIYLRRMEQAG